MAIVKGLNTPGRFKSDAIGILPVVDPTYGYPYSYGYPNTNPLRQSFPVILGGIVPTGTPVSPLIPADMYNQQNLLQRPKSYDCKYPTKPKTFNSVLPAPAGGTGWTDNENDSVTTSDSLAFDVGETIADSVTPSDNVVTDQVFGDPVFP